MDSAWDAIDLGRATGLFVLGVVLIGAATSAIPAIADGQIDILGEFVRLVVTAMLIVSVLAGAWSWINAAVPGR